MHFIKQKVYTSLMEAKRLAIGNALKQ